MDAGASSNVLFAYAVCPQDWRHFATGFADIREAPQACPICGSALHVSCPRCGMLYRTGTGICSNCGAALRDVAPPSQPARPQE